MADRMARQLACLLLFVLAWSTPAGAAYTPPAIAGHVTDAAHKLSAMELEGLNKKLADYRRCSGHHVAVFFAASLEGESIEDVAYATFNTWKIGTKNADNGVLLVIAPNERRIRIETGKGVGGMLTDLEAAMILREQVGPHLKKDEFFAAADEGTSAIGRAMGGCPIAPAKPSTAPAKDDVDWPWQLTLVIVIAAGVAFVIAFRNNRPDSGDDIFERIFQIVTASVLAAFAAWVTLFIGGVLRMIFGDWGPLVGGPPVVALALVARRILWRIEDRLHRRRSAEWQARLRSGASTSSAAAPGVGSPHSPSLSSTVDAGSSSSFGSTSMSSSFSTSSSSTSTSSTDSSYSGGGGTSGGGGASDSY